MRAAVDSAVRQTNHENGCGGLEGRLHQNQISHGVLLARTDTLPAVTHQRWWERDVMNKAVGLFAAFASGLLTSNSWAQTPTVTNPISQLINDSANDGNFATGLILYEQANVTPTSPGSIFGFFRQGTQGLAPFTRPIDLDPTWIAASIPYNAGLTGAWTYTFSTTQNFAPGTVTTATSNAVGSIGAVPFVQSMTITPGLTPLTPSISWVLPPTTGTDPITGNQYTFNQVAITVSNNTNLITRTNVDPFSANFGSSFQQANVIYSSPQFTPSSTTSFTIPQTNNNPNNANFNAPILQNGPTYSIGIQLRDVVSGQTVALSNSFFDYTPSNLPANIAVNLPTAVPVSTTSGGTSPFYKFNVANVGPTSVTYIDPIAANGFIYTIGNGDPNFKSVMPVTKVGNGMYQLLVWNGTGFDLVDSALGVGDTFDFLAHGFSMGVSEFEIIGLDPGVNPTDVTAFVTGLTFMMDGSFTGTMQPIVTSVSVPGPIVGAGLPGIIFVGSTFFAWRRRQRRVGVSSPP